MKYFLKSFFIFAALFAFLSSAQAREQQEEIAIFATGCFWCTESDFDKVPGVLSTTSGYTGGTLKAPSYKQVSRGGTGHYEALQLVFDPEKVTYEELLDVFWRTHDPFDSKGQFCDKGDQYRAAIFVKKGEQKEKAQQSKIDIESLLGKKTATKILSAQTFYPAEEYHQDYYQKNTAQYKFYRYRCGRDQRLKKIWKQK